MWFSFLKCGLPLSHLRKMLGPERKGISQLRWAVRQQNRKCSRRYTDVGRNPHRRGLEMRRISLTLACMTIVSLPLNPSDTVFLQWSPPSPPWSHFLHSRSSPHFGCLRLYFLITLCDSSSTLPFNSFPNVCLTKKQKQTQTSPRYVFLDYFLLICNPIGV